jgi:hypothetical protein
MLRRTTELTDERECAHDTWGATGAFTGAALFGNVVHFLPPIFYLTAFLLPQVPGLPLDSRVSLAQ